MSPLSDTTLIYSTVVFILLEEIRQQGLEKINLDSLVEKMLPVGRSLVPSDVKESLLVNIKGVLEKDSEYKKLTGFDQ